MSWHKHVFDLRDFFALSTRALKTLHVVIANTSDLDAIADFVDLLSDAEAIEKKIEAFKAEAPTEFKSVIYGYILDVERNREPTHADYKRVLNQYETERAWFSDARRELATYLAKRQLKSNPSTIGEQNRHSVHIMRDAGFTLKEIARALGLKIAMVMRYSSTKTETSSERKLKNILAMADRGFSMGEIANALSLNPAAVWQYLQRMKIDYTRHDAHGRPKKK